jgi:uncharacterized Zn-finger protein
LQEQINDIGSKIATLFSEISYFRACFLNESYPIMPNSYNFLDAFPINRSSTSPSSFTVPGLYPVAPLRVSFLPILDPTNLFADSMQQPRRGKKSEEFCRKRKYVESEDYSPRFVCPCHKKPFANKFSLTRHLRLQKGLKRHICAICSKPHAEKSQLQRHLQHHFQSKPFVCPVPKCPKKYADKTNLERHRRIVHC